jgi:hypothetical protein
MRTIRPRYAVVCNFVNEDGEQSITAEKYVAFSAARARREKLIDLGSHPDSVWIVNWDEFEDDFSECFGG